MDKPKKQLMRYSDEEISLIKNTFKDEDFLKEIRKHFLQMDNKLTLAPDAIKVLRKTLLPELDGDAPMHQIIDLWLTVNIKDKNPLDGLNFVKAREILIKYFEQGFDELDGKKVTKRIKLADLTKVVEDPDLMMVNLVARNEIITHIEQQIGQLNILAIQDTQKLVDEMMKNSSK